MTPNKVFFEKKVSNTLLINKHFDDELNICGDYDKLVFDKDTSDVNRVCL